MEKINVAEQENQILTMKSKISECLANIAEYENCIQEIEKSNCTQGHKSFMKREYKKQITIARWMIKAYKADIKFCKYLISQDRKGLELCWVSKEKVA